MGPLIMTPRNSALPLTAVVRVPQPADRASQHGESGEPIRMCRNDFGQVVVGWAHRIHALAAGSASAPGTVWDNTCRSMPAAFGHLGRGMQACAGFVPL